MNGIGLPELIVILASSLFVVPCWVIFKKAGFPGPLSLFILVPVLNLVVLYYVAFSRWPSQTFRATGKNPPPFDPIHPS